MSTICGTRVVKIAKYLHEAVPDDIPRSAIDDYVAGLDGADAALGSVPRTDEALRVWLERNPVPVPTGNVMGPLFHGTLVFVRMSFVQPGGASSAMSLSDVQVAAEYARRAIDPIQRYAAGYGPNSVDTSLDVIEFDAQLTGNSFGISDFQGWVDQCASTAKNHGISSPCIIVLHNRDLPNSPTFVGHKDSFHSMTGSANPYCYSLVFGEGLTVADNNHTINGRPNDKVYAHNLSHEIAEMVVDPRVDGSRCVTPAPETATTLGSASSMTTEPS